MSDDQWARSAPPPPPGHSPNPSPPTQTGGFAPTRRPASSNSSGALRDTLIVAALAVIGVAVMLLWSGGNVPGGASVSIQAPVGSLTVPGTFAVPTLGGQAPGIATDTAPQAGAAVAVTLPAGPGGSANLVAADNALAAALPAPAGGQDRAATSAGERLWAFPSTGWQTVRDAWVAAITSAGYTVGSSGSITDSAGSPTGESYFVSDPATFARVLAIVKSDGGAGSTAAVQP